MMKTKEGYYYFENEEDKYKNFFKNANDEIISIFESIKKPIPRDVFSSEFTFDGKKYTFVANGLPLRATSV